jgi:hypothetical protein
MGKMSRNGRLTVFLTSNIFTGRRGNKYALNNIDKIKIKPIFRELSKNSVLYESYENFCRTTTAAV